MYHERRRTSRRMPEAFSPEDTKRYLSEFLTRLLDAEMTEPASRLGFDPEDEWTRTITTQRKVFREQEDASLEDRVSKLSSEMGQVKAQVLQCSASVDKLNGLVNQYFKLDTREESVRTFGELISKVSEIKEVYAVHESAGVVFWLAYDQGTVTDILEKVVDIEMNYEKLFDKLDFDYRVIPYQERGYPTTAHAEVIYRRKE